MENSIISSHALLMIDIVSISEVRTMTQFINDLQFLSSNSFWDIQRNTSIYLALPNVNKYK